jgi:hypothetical protein
LEHWYGGLGLSCGTGTLEEEYTIFTKGEGVKKPDKIDLCVSKWGKKLSRLQSVLSFIIGVRK